MFLLDKHKAGLTELAAGTESGHIPIRWHRASAIDGARFHFAVEELEKEKED